MSLIEMLMDRYGGVMKTRDVAEVLNCHQSHVRALCQNGQLPAIQIGKRWFVPTAKFAQMLEGGNNATV